jgi:hypothetical protein
MYKHLKDTTNSPITNKETYFIAWFKYFEKCIFCYNTLYYSNQYTGGYVKIHEEVTSYYLRDDKTCIKSKQQSTWYKSLQTKYISNHIYELVSSKISNLNIYFCEIDKRNRFSLCEDFINLIEYYNLILLQKLTNDEDIDLNEEYLILYYLDRICVNTDNKYDILSINCIYEQICKIYKNSKKIFKKQDLRKYIKNNHVSSYITKPVSGLYKFTLWYNPQNKQYNPEDTIYISENTDEYISISEENDDIKTNFNKILNYYIIHNTDSSRTNDNSCWNENTITTEYIINFIDNFVFENIIINTILSSWFITKAITNLMQNYKQINCYIINLILDPTLNRENLLIMVKYHKLYWELSKTKDVNDIQYDIVDTYIPNKTKESNRFITTNTQTDDDIIEYNCNGYIYCLSNQGYIDILKIGFTTRTLEQRIKELNKETCLVYPFKLEIAKKTNNCQKKEKILHSILHKYRVSNSREFFKVSLGEVQLLFDLIDGESNENQHVK